MTITSVIEVASLSDPVTLAVLFMGLFGLATLSLIRLLIKLIIGRIRDSARPVPPPVEAKAKPRNTRKLSYIKLRSQRAA